MRHLSRAFLESLLKRRHGVLLIIQFLNSIFLYNKIAYGGVPGNDQIALINSMSKNKKSMLCKHKSIKALLKNYNKKWNVPRMKEISY